MSHDFFPRLREHLAEIERRNAGTAESGDFARRVAEDILDVIERSIRDTFIEEFAELGVRVQKSRRDGKVEIAFEAGGSKVSLLAEIVSGNDVHLSEVSEKGHKARLNADLHDGKAIEETTIDAAEKLGWRFAEAQKRASLI